MPTDFPPLTLPERDIATEHAVAVANMRLVYRAVHDLAYLWRDWLDVEDAHQIGMVGLVRAVQLFDPGKGFQFSTYATHAIQNAVRGAVTEAKRLHLWQLPMVRDPEGELVEWEPLCEEPMPEEQAHVRHLVEIAHHMLSLVPGQDGEVLGMVVGEGLNNVEISERMGVSNERIRQIKVRAMERLRWLWERMTLVAEEV